MRQWGGGYGDEPLSANSVLKKALATIRGRMLFREGDRVIAAVSGGADSVALLDILVSLRDLELDIVVAHMNHQLRGADSDGDAAFVRKLAERFGRPFEMESVDVLKLSRDRKLSLEDAGRTARYQWFRQLARGYRARRVALGHHADDQAETFLLRLLRGAGTTGLGAMRHLAAELYARPLLDVTRSEILSYLEERGLEFREDRSNDDRSFLRNRIRHECIPYLATYNPALTERLNAAAEILAADEELLESFTGRIFARIASLEPGTVTLRLPQVRAELPAMRMRLYRRAIREVSGSLSGIAGVHLRQIDELALSSAGNGRASLPRGLTAAKCYDTLSLTSRLADKDAAPWEVTIGGTGVYRLPDGRVLTIQAAQAPKEWKSLSPDQAYVNHFRNPFPWTLRTFRPGDRFHPLGMKGTKKVKDFFIDGKVPPDDRRRIPLLFCGAELLWICGPRIAEPASVSAGEAEAIRVEITVISP